MGLLEAAIGAVAPQRCAACGRLCPAESVICVCCEQRLELAAPLVGMGPPGVDRAWASGAHERAIRDLVTALKFRRLLPVADLMAERIQRLAPADLLSGTIVPVPTARLRSMRRGFDPAGELAGALAERLDVTPCPCLVRSGGGRQVGKGRAERIAQPPRIRAKGDAPRSTLLIDDVMTTGATISSCARALRDAGAVRIVAVTFARRP